MSKFLMNAVQACRNFRNLFVTIVPHSSSAKEQLVERDCRGALLEYWGCEEKGGKTAECGVDFCKQPSNNKKQSKIYVADKEVNCRFLMF